ALPRQFRSVVEAHSENESGCPTRISVTTQPGEFTSPHQVRQFLKSLSAVLAKLSHIKALT
ncbi:MAG: hypothetical protein WA322_25925, partial [Pseudolabrys sp.]